MSPNLRREKRAAGDRTLTEWKGEEAAKKAQHAGKEARSSPDETRGRPLPDERPAGERASSLARATRDDDTAATSGDGTQRGGRGSKVPEKLLLLLCGTYFVFPQSRE